MRALLVVSLLVLAACGPDRTETPPADVRTLEAVTVTEHDAVDGRPRLCEHGLKTSRPPQCSGADVVLGWDWDETWGWDGEPGQRWGEFCLRGRDTPNGFRLTEAPRPAGTCGRPEHVVDATVLEDVSHGPQLCLGIIETSYPPRCSGPDVRGWDWDRTEGFQTSGRSRFGELGLRGVHVDGALVLTRAPTRPTGVPSDRGPDVPTTPCPEPDGGWFAGGEVASTGGAAQDVLHAAMRHAERMPHVSSVWPEYLGGPTDGNRAVLTVRVTEDVAAARRELRALWPGALCVRRGGLTQQHRLRIATELHRTLGRALIAVHTESHDHVAVQVLLDEDGALQRRLDDRYGEGVVRVGSALQPAP